MSFTWPALNAKTCSIFGGILFTVSSSLSAIAATALKVPVIPLQTLVKIQVNQQDISGSTSKGFDLEEGSIRTHWKLLQIVFQKQKAPIYPWSLSHKHELQTRVWITKSTLIKERVVQKDYKAITIKYEFFLFVCSQFLLSNCCSFSLVCCVCRCFQTQMPGGIFAVRKSQAAVQ